MTSATAEVPSSIDGVTPQWLTAVLDGATVTDVHAEQIALDTGSHRGCIGRTCPVMECRTA